MTRTFPAAALLVPLTCAAVPLSEPPMTATRYLELPDGRIAYGDTGGDGPLIVAIPGLGDVRGEYRFLREALAADGYRVVTLDLRGHGESDTTFREYGADAIGTDALALIEHLDSGPAVLVGTSAGAGAAAFAAAERKDLVSGLVLIGAFVRDHETSLGMHLAMKTLFGGPWRVSAWLWYFDSLFPTTKPRDHAAYKAALGANLKEPGRFDAALAMMSASKQAVEERLPLIEARTLVVMGTKDPDFKSPQAEAHLIASRTKGEVVMIEGAGHYPHAEMPDVTSAAVVAFLKSLALPR